MADSITGLLGRCRILTALFLILLFSITVAAAAGPAGLLPAQPAAEQTAPLIKEPATPKITIPNLVSYTTRLSEQLIDLQSQLSKIPPATDIDKALPEIKKALEELNWTTMMQQADSNLSYKQLSKTVQQLNLQQDRLNDVAEPLNKGLNILAAQEESWNTERETLTTWTEKLKDKKSYPLLEPTILELQKSMASAVDTIDVRLRNTLTALHELSGLQIRMYNLKATAEDMMTELRKTGWQQTSPTFFSRKFYSSLSPNLLVTVWHEAATELQAMTRKSLVYGKSMLLILFFPVLFSILIKKNSHHLSKHQNWTLLTSRPVAFSVFTSLTYIVPWLGPATANIIPLISVALIFSVMFLAGKLEKRSAGVVRFIYFLSLYLVVSMLVDFINLPLPLQRIYLLVGSCCWLAYFIWRIFALRKHKIRYSSWALYILSLALAAVISAAFLGYDELASYLFNGVFLTIFTFISSVILFNTTTILFELLLSLLPVIRRHAKIITRSLQPLIFTLCALVFYSITAGIWRMFPTAREALTALASLGIPMGSYTMTMSTIFTIVAILYGSVLISRATRAILLDEVLPRYNIDMGVQLSITRLVHYAILLIGIIILIRAMGANLTKLTILGGALSVGIGFGLQAIVNNFASGLILLFERPIKVGDTIELGTDMGEVKKLGLRSTIIQTFDNAEIVVPNSELIAGQVTNWTLAERLARVKLPVGVAYGSDIPKVLEILLRVADEHPMTLTTPPPNALFLAFGASSLDFELRVWIADFNYRRQVQSELNQEINSEFADAGIEIPFPQTDLHIRTVASEAAEALIRPKQPTPPSDSKKERTEKK